jgi:hypothetical protein
LFLVIGFLFLSFLNKYKVSAGKRNGEILLTENNIDTAGNSYEFGCLWEVLFLFSKKSSKPESLLYAFYSKTADT